MDIIRTVLVFASCFFCPVGAVCYAVDPYAAQPIGLEVKGEPWISNVRIADLDLDGLLDVLVCDGRLNKVSWIRQTSLGNYEEQLLTASAPGPVFTETVDMNGDGLLDVLVACMGMVVPNNGRIGSVLLLESKGDGSFEQRVLLEHVPRVTYVASGDLNGDGKLDLSVGMFGFFDGEIAWLENLGDLEFKRHTLLDLSGTIHAPICDINNDGFLDIVALVSQDWEEIHVFVNDGKGNFSGKVVYGALNKDFGSSGICVEDLDGDGDVDIVYTNGDGLDYATPGPRSWHGVQWLKNDGNGKFEYTRVGDLPGAHSPVVVDIDKDGLLDIVVVSAYNDWTSSNSDSIACFKQAANGEFSKVSLAHRPSHQISLDAADMDGDGEVEFVSGAFMYYPPFDNPSRVSVWDLSEKKIDESK